MQQQQAKMITNQATLLRRTSSSTMKNSGPKKPLTAFMFYVALNRQAVLRDNSKLTVIELASMMGEMWRQLSEEERSKYTKMAAQDEQRFETEMLLASGNTGVSLVPCKRLHSYWFRERVYLYRGDCKRARFVGSE